MLKFIIYCIMILSIVSSSLFATSISLNEKEKDWIKKNTVKIGISPWKPISYYNDQTKKIDGISGDILNLVIQKLKLKVEIIPDNWKNTITNLENHTIDLHPSVYYTKKRTTFGVYNTPHLSIKEYLYTKENSKITGFESLKNRKIAILKNYGTIPKIRKKYPSIQIIETDSLEESVKLVLNGNVDALFGIQLVVNNHLDNNIITGLKSIYQTDFTPSSIHFFSNNQKPMLNKILQKGLDSVTKEEKAFFISKWLKRPKDIQVLDFLNSEEKQYIQNNQTIKMCNNHDWEPIEFKKDGKVEGIVIDTMQQLSKQLNIKFQHIPTKNWQQSQEFLKERKCDILPGAIKTPQRELYANFTDPYLKLPLAIFTAKDKDIVSSLDNIIDKSLSINAHSDIVTILQNKYPKIKITEAKDNTETLRLVNNNEVYFTIATLPVASNIISKYILKNLQIAGYSNIVYKLSIAVRDDNPILLSILDKSLKNISQESSNKIFTKWVNQPVKEATIDYSLVLKILGLATLIILFFVYRQYMLKQSIKSLDQLLDSTIDAIAFFKDDKLNNANQVFLDIYGYSSKKEILGRSSLSFVESSHHTYFKEKTNKTKTPYEIDMIKSDNTIFPALVRETQVSHNLKVTSVLDLTELKKKDKLLLEQSKLASMGEMIGNIAHQWRQPLSVISTGATGIKLQKEFNILTDEEFNQTCDAINENAQYLSKTIDDFKNFIEGDRTKKLFILKDTIKSFLNLVNGSVVSSDVPIILDIDESIQIDGYENELIQCLINIFNNSRDALEGNDIEDKLVSISTSTDTKNVTINLKDNAGGIADDILPKIFEPYFTTKHQSQGTGLGLHMTYIIITDGMKGTIKAKNIDLTHNNQVYKGAEFSICLPLS